MGPTLLRMLGSQFYRQIRIERKISFILVYNTSGLRPIWMGQMAAQVGGLLLLLLLVFCGSVNAVGEGSGGPKTGSGADLGWVDWVASHPPLE